MTPRKNRGIFAYLLIFVLAVMGVSYVMSKISDSGKKTEYSEIGGSQSKIHTTWGIILVFKTTDSTRFWAKSPALYI